MIMIFGSKLLPLCLDPGCGSNKLPFLHINPSNLHFESQPFRIRAYFCTVFWVKEVKWKIGRPFKSI
jgi:hypothetical protein